MGQARLKAWLAGSMVAMTALSVGCGPTYGPMMPALTAAPAVSAASMDMHRLVIKYRNPATRTAGMVSAQAAAQPLTALGAEVVNLPPNADPGAEIQRLSADPNVEYVEPVQRMAVRLPSKPRALSLFQTPSVAGKDPLRNQQWALDTVEAEGAWKVTLGSPKVVIAIVDSGIDQYHPDLRDKLVPGWSAIGGATNIKDEDGHGTHCAGIAAAATGNRMGIAGMAPNVKIMPVRVLDDKGEGDDKDIAAGVMWAANHGASIISMSVGGDSSNKVLRDAIAYAQKKNCLIVAAMGNDGNSAPNYPAKYPGVMAIGATDSSDNLADFSNMGSWISVTAPGIDILSTMPTYHVGSNDEGSGMGYAKEDGTSMATPLVAGLAALVRSRWPELTQDQVKAKIEQSADDLGPQGFDNKFGHGRINARRALTGS